MIRINLLPKEQRRPEIPYARVSLFFIGVVLIIVSGIYAVEAYTVSLLDGDRAVVRERYEDLLPVRQAMEQAGDKQKQIDAKLALVNELQKTRTTSYNLLPRVSALLTDAIWLNETKVNKEDARIITIVGETIDYNQLATFISRLENEPLFSSVTIKSTEGDVKVGTWKFTLDLKLKESK